AGRDAADAPPARRDGALRDPLFPRFRAAGKAFPRAERGRARRAARPARCARAAVGREHGGADPGCCLRDRPAGAVPRPQEEGQGRQAGRLARLVQHALPGAARAGERPALRLVRRGLRHRQHGRDDRRRAGALGVGHDAKKWTPVFGQDDAKDNMSPEMPIASLAVIGGTILVSSFISGTFGMAGGMVLLGVLLIYFDVATAMVLFSIIQFVANASRAVLWRHFVLWRILLEYAVGGVIAFAILRMIAYVPDK